jgi:hypothetical protein
MCVFEIGDVETTTEDILGYKIVRITKSGDADVFASQFPPFSRGYIPDLLTVEIQVKWQAKGYYIPDNTKGDSRTYEIGSTCTSPFNVSLGFFVLTDIPSADYVYRRNATYPGNSDTQTHKIFTTKTVKTMYDFNLRESVLRVTIPKNTRIRRCEADLIKVSSLEDKKRVSCILAEKIFIEEEITVYPEIKEEEMIK